MPRHLFLIVLLLVSCATAVVPAQQTAVGDWQGPLKVGAAILHLVLHIVQDKDGLTASLDSPDQGVSNVPVSDISFTDRKLTLSIDVIAGSYAGTLSADGMTIEGTWSQGNQSLPLTFTRAAPSGR